MNVYLKSKESQIYLSFGLITFFVQNIWDVLQKSLKNLFS